MIEEVGTIVELKSKSTALVLCQKSSFCKSCASSGACSLGEDSRSRMVEAHNMIGANVGDRVKIAASSAIFLQSSFVLYIVPLIALVIGAVVGNALGTFFPLGVDPNLLSAIFGVFFMIGSFLIIRVGSGALRAEKFMPEIVTVLPPEE
jgi:sigma-E factor negative regulatory protein RseC